MLINFIRTYSEKMASFRSKIPAVQAARTVLAIATLTVLISTSWESLTPEIAGLGRPSYCEPPLSLGLFCMDASADKFYARGFAVLVLILVALGVVPAISSWLHAWTAFSFSVGIGLPDGGEQVSQVVTALAVLICINDWSWCAWRPQMGALFKLNRIDSGFQGIRWAAWIGIRMQVAYIYLNSGLSKLPQEDWMNGSAMYYFVRDPSFGVSGPLSDFVMWLTDFDLGVAFLTWTPILMEATIAILIFGGPLRRRLAFWIAAILHGGIILLIGLWSFGLIMIGSVALAAFPRYEPNPSRHKSTNAVLVSSHTV
ncbi:hypothetical protein ACIPYU_06880 [Paenarthrobacter nicotinovorans]|jgi:antimicrobial peptide system SdpB family protein|uniref:hypothetical protein n=1 Tax=Paenarthrobacter nicotinovorans TaxID=29320 RepID=UPI003827809C